MVEEAKPARGERRESPYSIWQKNEGIPLYQGAYIENLYKLELGAWPRLGQPGAIINLADQEHDDGWLVEIAPGGQTTVQHHLFEATVFVLSGRGATMFWQEGQPKDSVEWQRGSIFSPPLNCHYQHFNASGEEAVRLFVVTNAPMVINMFRDGDFPFDDSYRFANRYQSGVGFFEAASERSGRNMWITNFISDIRSFGLDDAAGRGAGGQLTQFSMSNNSMVSHCSDFPPGTYKKAHRHGVGAHVIILRISPQQDPGQPGAGLSVGQPPRDLPCCRLWQGALSRHATWAVRRPSLPRLHARPDRVRGRRPDDLRGLRGRMRNKRRHGRTAGTHVQQEIGGHVQLARREPVEELLRSPLI